MRVSSPRSTTASRRSRPPLVPRAAAASAVRKKPRVRPRFDAYPFRRYVQRVAFGRIRRRRSRLQQQNVGGGSVVRSRSAPCRLQKTATPGATANAPSVNFISAGTGMTDCASDGRAPAQHSAKTANDGNKGIFFFHVFSLRNERRDKIRKKGNDAIRFFLRRRVPAEKKRARRFVSRRQTRSSFLQKSAEPPNGPARNPLQFSSVPATSASEASAFGASAEAARRAARVSAA